MLRSENNAADAAQQRIELFNLTAAHPEIVRDLTARYEAYARAAVPLVGGEPVPNFKAPRVWGEVD